MGDGAGAALGRVLGRGADADAQPRKGLGAQMLDRAAQAIVATGTAANDAVNFGQMQEVRKMLSAGIASTAAMSNIPLVDPSKSFAVGVGFGGYDSQSAVAVGASYRISPAAVLRGSIAGGSNSKTTVGAGFAFSW